jgi:hypothetical protein
MAAGDGRLSAGMSRKFVGVVFAAATALFVASLGCTHALAAIDRDKPAVPAVEPAAKTTVAAVTKKSAAKKKARAKKTASKAKRAPMPLIIVTKPANDAPDFDYQDRIAEAQALAAKQPVLKDDMQFDGRGNLTRFTWVLVVGQKAGPLTVLRMDEKGNNDQGFTVTWPVDNFINTKFRVTRPEGYIVFAQRRPVRVPSYDRASAVNGYQVAVYTSYAPEMDTKTMRAAGMEYLRHLQRLAYMRIKDHDVRSRVAPGATVADRIPTSMVVRLMITEHIDPLHMKYRGDRAVHPRSAADHRRQQEPRLCLCQVQRGRSRHVPVHRRQLPDGARQLSQGAAGAQLRARHGRPAQCRCWPRCCTWISN